MRLVYKVMVNVIRITVSLMFFIASVILAFSVIFTDKTQIQMSLGVGVLILAALIIVTEILLQIGKGKNI